MMKLCLLLTCVGVSFVALAAPFPMPEPSSPGRFTLLENVRHENLFSDYVTEYYAESTSIDTRFQAGGIAREVVLPDPDQIASQYNRNIRASMYLHKEIVGLMGSPREQEKQVEQFAKTHQWYVRPNPDSFSHIPWILSFEPKRAPLPAPARSDSDWEIVHSDGYWGSASR
jgi:hypothetical protein